MTSETTDTAAIHTFQVASPYVVMGTLFDAMHASVITTSDETKRDASADPEAEKIKWQRERPPYAPATQGTWHAAKLARLDRNPPHKETDFEHACLFAWNEAEVGSTAADAAKFLREAPRTVLLQGSNWGYGDLDPRQTFREWLQNQKSLQNQQPGGFGGGGFGGGRVAKAKAKDDSDDDEDEEDEANGPPKTDPTDFSVESIKKREEAYQRFAARFGNKLLFFGTAESFAGIPAAPVAYHIERSGGSPNAAPDEVRENGFVDVSRCKHDVTSSEIAKPDSHAMMLLGPIGGPPLMKPPGEERQTFPMPYVEFVNDADDKFMYIRDWAWFHPKTHKLIAVCLGNLNDYERNFSACSVGGVPLVPEYVDNVKKLTADIMKNGLPGFESVGDGNILTRFLPTKAKQENTGGDFLITDLTSGAGGSLHNSLFTLTEDGSQIIGIALGVPLAAIGAVLVSFRIVPKNLPRSLRYLNVFSPRGGFDKAEMAFEDFPSSLEILELCSSEDGAMVDLVDVNFASLPKSLKVLLLRGKTFAGKLPSFALLPPKLTYLSISHSNFSGPIDLGSIPASLCHIDLACNNFSGKIDNAPIPDWVGHLNLSSNHIDGDLPPNTASLASTDMSPSSQKEIRKKRGFGNYFLVRVDLSYNHFNVPTAAASTFSRMIRTQGQLPLSLSKGNRFADGFTPASKLPSDATHTLVADNSSPGFTFTIPKPKQDATATSDEGAQFYANTAVVCIGSLENAMEGCVKHHRNVQPKWCDASVHQQQQPRSGFDVPQNPAVDMVLPVVHGEWGAAELFWKGQPCGGVYWHKKEIGPTVGDAAAVLRELEGDCNMSWMSDEATEEDRKRGFEVIGPNQWGKLRSVMGRSHHAPGLPWPTAPDDDEQEQEKSAFPSAEVVTTLSELRFKGATCFFAPPQLVTESLIPALAAADATVLAGVSLLHEKPKVGGEAHFSGAVCNLPRSRDLFGTVKFQTKPEATKKNKKAVFLSFYTDGGSNGFSDFAIGRPSNRIYPEREKNFRKMLKHIEEGGIGITPVDGKNMPLVYEAVQELRELDAATIMSEEAKCQKLGELFERFVSSELFFASSFDCALHVQLPILTEEIAVDWAKLPRTLKTLALGRKRRTVFGVAQAQEPEEDLTKAKKHTCNAAELPPNLEALYLCCVRFAGNFDFAAITYMKNLSFIDLSDGSNFSGALAADIIPPNVSRFDISGNSFTGTIDMLQLPPKLCQFNVDKNLRLRFANVRQFRDRTQREMNDAKKGKGECQRMTDDGLQFSCVLLPQREEDEECAKLPQEEKDKYARLVEEQGFRNGGRGWGGGGFGFGAMKVEVKEKPPIEWGFSLSPGEEEEEE